jgi:hypothetical protein
VAKTTNKRPAPSIGFSLARIAQLLKAGAAPFTDDEMRKHFPDHFPRLARSAIAEVHAIRESVAAIPDPLRADILAAIRAVERVLTPTATEADDFFREAMQSDSPVLGPPDPISAIGRPAFIYAAEKHAGALLLLYDRVAEAATCIDSPPVPTEAQRRKSIRRILRDELKAMLKKQASIEEMLHCYEEGGSYQKGAELLREKFGVELDWQAFRRRIKDRV